MPEMESSGPVACRACRHFHITWDPQAPYGCRGHGFKSRQDPAQVVHESSGMVCQLFVRKILRNSDRDDSR